MFERFKILRENMAAMCSKPEKKLEHTNKCWCKRPRIGKVLHVQILLLSYTAYFSCQQLHSDTDRLLYKLESDELYYELEKQTQDVKKAFGFFFYPDGHALHDYTKKCKLFFIFQFSRLKTNIFKTWHFMCRLGFKVNQKTFWYFLLILGPGKEADLACGNILFMLICLLIWKLVFVKTLCNWLCLNTNLTDCFKWKLNRSSRLSLQIGSPT